MKDEYIKTLQILVCKKWNLPYKETRLPDVCEISPPEEQHGVTEEHREMHGPSIK